MAYRQNHAAAAARVEPERCTLCQEFLARHVVRVYPADGYVNFHYACDECLENLVIGLRRRELEYRVGRLRDV